MLVFPAAVKVYDETEFAIKRLVSLRKHISRDEPAAYEEATTLLERLTGYKGHSKIKNTPHPWVGPMLLGIDLL